MRTYSDTLGAILSVNCSIVYLHAVAHESAFLGCHNLLLGVAALMTLNDDHLAARPALNDLGMRLNRML